MTSRTRPVASLGLSSSCLSCLASPTVTHPTSPSPPLLSLSLADILLCTLGISIIRPALSTRRPPALAASDADHAASCRGRAGVFHGGAVRGRPACGSLAAQPALCCRRHRLGAGMGGHLRRRLRHGRLYGSAQNAAWRFARSTREADKGNGHRRLCSHWRGVCQRHDSRPERRPRAHTDVL